MAWGKGERMGRMWPIQFPCVLLTMGMIPPLGSIHCYHKGKYRNSIGVCSRIMQMYTWVWGVESVYTPSSLNLVMTTLKMRCYHSCKSDGEDGIRASLPLWVIFSGNLAMGEALFKGEAAVVSVSKNKQRFCWDTLQDHTYFLHWPNCDFCFQFLFFLWQILVLKGLKRKLHF